MMASASIRGDWVRSLLNYAIIAVVIVLMCSILYLFLTQGQKIIRKIGDNGSIGIKWSRSSPSASASRSW